MPEVRPLGIHGVIEIAPKRFSDARGFFSETYSREAFEAAGIAVDFVQDNHSYSAEAGVLRGLHYQLPPSAQAKLVRVAKGRVLDVAVDIRRGSQSFGRSVCLELSADRWNQIFIPIGFAHGFLTLEPGTEVIYKVTANYSPAHERSIRYDDPELAIDWPLSGSAPILSAKDAKAPYFAEAEVFP